MLFNLVRKDYILAKKYLLLLFVVAVGAPVYLSLRMNIQGRGIASFLMTALMIEYLLFSTVSMAEDKYKGSSLLCATPYTRTTMVESKYLFVFINFAICCIVYAISSHTVAGMEKFHMHDFEISLLTICIFFGIAIPLQYKFGFEKLKYIFTFIIFIVPFTAPSVMQYAEKHNIRLDILSAIPNGMQDIVSYGLAIVITLVSLDMSLYIYSKRNL